MTIRIKLSLWKTLRSFDESPNMDGVFSHPTPFNRIEKV